ncbi:MAG: DNA replication protein DnaD, partial [Firmicutes bacterium]|nr:DNA replication protein DnaD [Bacillota bacterium]
MQIDSLFPVGFAPVPYSFIDRYMTGANGEFVKTYLLLLRLSGEGSVSVSVLADRLDQTEKDVRRALKYWEKAGLLSLRELDGEILSLRLLLPEEKAG